MTPPCPNCGTIYSEGPEVNGWRTQSISESVIFEDKLDGSPAFWGPRVLLRQMRRAVARPRYPAPSRKRQLTRAP